MSVCWSYRCKNCHDVVLKTSDRQDDIEEPQVHDRCGGELEDSCNKCRGPLRGYYRLIDGKRLCADCLEKVNNERNEQSRKTRRSKESHEYKVLDPSSAVDRHIDTDRIDQAIHDAKVVAANHPGTDTEQEQLQLSMWLEELKFQRSNVERLTTALTYKNPVGVRVYIDGPVEPTPEPPPRTVVDDERMLRAERLLLCTARLVSMMNHGAANMKDIFEQDELTQEFGRGEGDARTKND
jgi:uncharacterized Zn finger protein (UPF0148 family)